MPVLAPDYTELFGAWGRAYDSAFAVQSDTHDDELRALVGMARLRGDEIVCDVPAGGGYLARALPPGVRVIACETVAAFAAACPRRPGYLAVRVGAMEALPLPDGSVDRVLSHAGVHHCPDKRALLAEWSRVLRPGGGLALSDVTKGSAPSIFLDGFVGAHSARGHSGIYLDDAFERAFDGTGLVLEEDVEIAMHWRFASETALAEFCRRLFVLEELTDRAIVRAAERILGVERSAEGRVAMRWSLRHVYARKR